MKVNSYRCERWVRWGTAILLSLGIQVSQAQVSDAASYPSRTVRMLVPFGPGSATDVIARTIGEELNRELGRFFVVENRAGANGFIAAQAAASAAADGYTLFVSSASVHTLNPNMFRKLPYDPDKDFVAIGATHRAYYTVLVNKDLPVNSIAELITWLKRNPDKASYGWGATVGEVAGFEFLKRVGARAAGIAYKSSPQAMADLMGGQITFVLDGVPTTQALIVANRVKGLAVTSSERLPQLPNVPTMIESGLADFDVSTWAGLFAPTGTPPAIVQKINTALTKALRDPALIKRMDACCSVELFPTTPDEFERYVKADRALWAKKLKEAGMEPQ